MLSYDELERRRRREEFATYEYSPMEQKIAEQQTLREQKHYAQVASDLDKHFRQNGEFYTRTVKDPSGRTVTQQWWRGNRADGTRAKDQLLRSAYGKHSLSAFDSGTLDLKTDNYTRRFNQGAAYLLQRNVAYQMDPHERKLAEKMEADRAYKLAKFDRENPVVQPVKTTSQPVGEQKDPNRVRYEGSYWDRDTQSRQGYVLDADQRWKSPDGTFATRGAQMLYNLGVDKSEWDRADRAGRKQILAGLYQNSGVDSATSRYVRSEFANYINDRHAARVADAQRTEKSYRDKVEATAVGILGQEFWNGMDREAKNRFAKSLIRSDDQLAAGYDAYKEARALQRQVKSRVARWTDDAYQYGLQQDRLNRSARWRYS